MLESIQGNNLEYKRLSQEEMQSRGILGRLVGICADIVNPTRNGRKYSEQLWEQVFDSPLMKERIENGVCYGELGHPADREETDMEKIAVCLAEIPKKGKDGKLRAVFDILDTPNGRILKSLCDYGSTLGISSRGSGDLITDYDGQEAVNPDTYHCEGFDIVLLPAVKEARLQYVTESLNKTRYRKTLRDRLQESINKETEDNKKIMLESLHELGIDLDEADSKESNLNKLDAVIEHFGTTGNPYFGPTYILPNGEFLDLTKYRHHADVEKYLIDNNLSDYEYIATAGSPTMFDYGCIRCDMPKYVIVLTDKQPTREQLNSLLIWIDELYRSTKMVSVITPDNQVIDYNLNEIIADDVVGRIKRYYSSGVLFEKANMRRQHDFRYDRNPIGEGISLSANLDEEVTVSDSDWRNWTVGEEIKFIADEFDGHTEEDCVVVSIEDDHAIISPVNDSSVRYWIDDDLLESINEEQIGREETIPAKPAGEVLNTESGDSVDINISSEDDAVDDDKAIIEELQKALMLNRAMDKEIGALKEQLSVSYAKGTKLQEENAALKERIAKLSKSKVDARALSEKLEAMQKKVEHKDSVIAQEKKKVTESVSTSKRNERQLSEALKMRDDRLASLNEKLSSVESERDEYALECKTLEEQYTNTQKDLTQLKEQYSKKLERQNTLIERYQQIAKSAVNRYVKTQADMLGIRPVEIRNRLPENYTFEDIDQVCEDLREYKLNVSSLPFNVNRMNEGIQVTAKNVSKGLIPVDEDTEVTDYDLRIAGLI